MESPLFSEGWTGADEIKLLDTIQEQGYGNWDTVGMRMCRSDKECAAHYNTYYIDSSSSLLSSPRHTFPSLLESSQDDFFPSDDYPGKDIPHYNPLRADFDIEPYDDAEKTLSITDISSDEDREDTIYYQLILGLINTYWIVLKERHKTKSVIREHGLINIQKILVKEKLLQEEERSVRASMRPFVRFLDAETTEKLIQSFMYESQLIKRIKQFKAYRSLGIKSLAAVKLYERLKEDRIKTKETVRRGLDEITKNYRHLLSIPDHHNEPLPSLKPKYTVNPLDITYSPKVNQLEEDEKQLCTVNRILPDVYLRCKNLILAEDKKISGRKLKLMDARKVCRIDVNKTRKIYNLLLSKKLLS